MKQEKDTHEDGSPFSSACEIIGISAVALVAIVLVIIIALL